MREKIRQLILSIVRFLSRTVPYLPVMSQLNIFGSLRTARRYLTHLGEVDASAQPTSGPLVTPPNRNRFPSNIWLITEVTWEPHELIPEMQKIGNVFTTDLVPARAGAATRAKVVELIDRTKPDMRPDLIWFYAREALLSEDVFRALRKYDVPIWGMNSDDKADFFPREHSPFAGRDGYGRWVRFFDMNLSVCRAMIPHYLAAGAKVAYSPEGFHFRPEFEQPRPPVQDMVSFVAAWREGREEIIEKLRRYGVKVQVYGRGWKDSQWAEAPWKIFRASQLTLGDGVSFGSTMTNLKGRDFEAPGSNACYVTTYDWELADQFDIGREILCYRNADDLAELLYYYQARPEECAKIARAGFERAREYTWEKRFRKVMAQWF